MSMNATLFVLGVLAGIAITLLAVGLAATGSTSAAYHRGRRDGWDDCRRAGREEVNE